MDRTARDRQARYRARLSEAGHVRITVVVPAHTASAIREAARRLRSGQGWPVPDSIRRRLLEQGREQGRREALSQRIR